MLHYSVDNELMSDLSPGLSPDEGGLNMHSSMNLVSIIFR